MPRYLVERTFPDGLEIPTNDRGAMTCLGVVQNNAEEQVTWVTSFVSTDRTKTYCIYDGPAPESIRRAGEANGLPVDAVTEVRVLDPYFYTSSAS
jgi:Nickel responsive protein SCO4226-like